MHLFAVTIRRGGGPRAGCECRISDTTSKLAILDGHPNWSTDSHTSAAVLSRRRRPRDEAVTCRKRWVVSAIVWCFRVHTPERATDCDAWTAIRLRTRSWHPRRSARTDAPPPRRDGARQRQRRSSLPRPALTDPLPLRPQPSRAPSNSRRHTALKSPYLPHTPCVHRNNYDSEKVVGVGGRQRRKDKRADQRVRERNDRVSRKRRAYSTHEAQRELAKVA